MLLDIVINVILYVIISIASVGIITLIAHLIIRNKRKFKVEMIGGKYSPMSGKSYLRIDKSTGIIIKDKNIGNCLKFDTQGEAKIIFDEFLNQKRNARRPRSTDLKMLDLSL